MDNPTVLVNKAEQLAVEVLKYPNLKALLLKLSQSRKFRRLLDLVEAIGRAELIEPPPGATLPPSSSISVTFSAGSPTATYTINILDSNGAVVHTCSSVSIDPITLEGTCVIPAGTLGNGENFTIEIVTNGSTFNTLGWFMTTVAA